MVDIKLLILGLIMQKGKHLMIFCCLLFAGAISLRAQFTIDDSIYAGGQYRYYKAYIPAAYDGTEAVPLLFNLHGYSSDNFGQALYANFNPIADTAGFITVLPNGTFDLFGFRFWNCFVAPGTGVDDVAFLSALIDTIAAAYTIDMNRIYSTGMSNGGFMSYALACELSERIAAVASVTGTIDKNRLSYCAPVHQVPVMHIHGTEDDVVPYGENPSFFSVDSVIGYWKAFNHTDTEADFTAMPDIVTTDNCTAEHYVYDNGWAGSRVEHYKIIGGEHTWPGTAITFLGITNQDINACKEIWRFLSQYRLDQLTPVSDITTSASIHLYPNPAATQLLIQTPLSNAHITITDLSGRVMYNDVTAGNTIEISVDTWPAGMYFVRVEGEGLRETKMVVVRG